MPGVGPSWFQRYLLPGLAFKAVVIGGGYATGRELVEFFFPAGPLGGLWGTILAMAVWSLVCASAFMLARAASAYDYRSFFKTLLGPLWWLFEAVYLPFLILILAVVAAAAGEIGAAVFALPQIAGTLALVIAIAAVTSFGNRGAETLFRYASSFIYLVYAIFLVIAFARFGDRIGPALALDVPTDGWITGGLTYASYNVVAVVAVLPFVRNLATAREAAVAGALAGPLAMLPALLFFLCMAAFYPDIATAPLPSAFMLDAMGTPWLAVLFQLMIFCALLETGVGVVNSLNERIGEAIRRGRSDPLPPLARLAISATLLLVCAFLAARLGLVALIASGYGAFGYIMLGVFVLPLLVMTPRLLRRAQSLPAIAE
jgi:uncharacterized membrane protein YkvI